MKRNAVIWLLCLVLCAGLLAPGTLAWDADADWSGAYRSFVLEEGFRTAGRAYSSSAEYPLRFTLYDLDGDLQPELFLRDPLRAMVEEPYDVYTYRGGAVQYIGRLGVRGGEAHYAPGVGYPGVFSYDGAMGFYVGAYYTMRDGSVVSERVVETDGRSGTLNDTWITADKDLQAAFRSAYDGPVTDYTDYAELPSFNLEEIGDMGWETFASASGAAARFYDVPVRAYYAPAVAWAAEKEITNGVKSALFVPDGVCTRAQMVTFLWRAAGSPKPKAESAFQDVPADAWYARAVAWASAKGIALGTEPGTFSPNAPVTRGQTVTFLWRAAGAPKMKTKTVPFRDVSPERYYASAVRWALNRGVTNGADPGWFRPDRPCVRSQIVTFLYRDRTGKGVTLEDLTALWLKPGETVTPDDTFTDDGAESAALLMLGRNLKAVTLLRTEFSDGQLRVVGEPLHSFGDLSAGTSLLIETAFPDVGARVALRYTVGGQTHTVGLAASGKDETIVLIPMD